MEELISRCGEASPRRALYTWTRVRAREEASKICAVGSVSVFYVSECALIYAYMYILDNAASSLMDSMSSASLRMYNRRNCSYFKADATFETM